MWLEVVPIGFLLCQATEGPRGGPRGGPCGGPIGGGGRLLSFAVADKGAAGLAVAAGGSYGLGARTKPCWLRLALTPCTSPYAPAS